VKLLKVGSGPVGCVVDGICGVRKVGSYSPGVLMRCCLDESCVFEFGNDGRMCNRFEE
jgi:hypothetical protein